MGIDRVHVVGGGLAGCEAAWQLAEQGVPVTLHEMRPVRGTPAHRTDRLAELVCSNTFKSTELTNAHGLLKAEMRVLGSVILMAADEARVPGGSALAVDREAFAAAVTDRVSAHSMIRIERGEVTTLPSPGIVATGPLTSDALAAAIRERLGVDALAFYDAIAPVVSAESIDYGVVFRAARYGKETMGASADALEKVEGQKVESRERQAGAGAPEKVEKPKVEKPKVEKPKVEKPKVESRQGEDPPNAAGDASAGAYINCPFTREQYDAFIDALISADQYQGHEFDAVPYFEGCLPVEVMAGRGRDVLRFGPLKPVGLFDPRGGRRPYAVLQLRCEDRGERMWNLVGCQTRLRIPEQQRVFRLVPGLADVDFLRYGSIHRNSYLNAPAVLTPYLSTRDDPRLLLAGQMTGVEGYTESAATGLLAGINLARLLEGAPAVVPPPTTMLGALYRYLSEADPRHFQPMNANFGLLDDLPEVVRDKRRKRELFADRALAELTRWREAALGVAIGGTTARGEAGTDS